jgi:hypothetical protein
MSDEATEEHAGPDPKAWLAFRSRMKELLLRRLWRDYRQAQIQVWSCLCELPQFINGPALINLPLDGPAAIGDLRIDPDGFSAMLRMKGTQYRARIPWTGIEMVGLQGEVTFFDNNVRVVGETMMQGPDGPRIILPQ